MEVDQSEGEKEDEGETECEGGGLDGVCQHESGQATE
jgi:hypothetical protein